MTVKSLQSQLDAYDQAALCERENFRGRAEAIDAIAFEIIDRIDGLLCDPTQPQELHMLRQAAERLHQRLLAVDEELFLHLRAAIRGGCRGAALRHTIERYVTLPGASDAGPGVVGYDRLDRLVNGILGIDALPEAQLEPEPEMVLYQQTPARIIVELVQRTNLGPLDRFYDLGSGMGHVTTLVNLLSGAQTTGVEVEPAFCAYARASAAALGCAQVTFINADARQVDYTAGNVFFMYTPFEGAMLLEVLGRLRERAQRGPIRLATYGPCTAIVAQQGWLSAPRPADPGSYRLALFHRADGATSAA
jgi:hypothetical protein